jgi:hypothetical protein
MAERKPYAFMCGTPKEHCSGSPGNVNAALGGNRKIHGSSEEAFKCHKQYLIDKMGYTQGDDARALHAPNDGPVRILTKPSRFGAKLRNGKEGTRNMSSVRIKNGSRGGIIVSS